ncbi:hypothetical protein BKA69DRAFT_1165867 [Paraphysoderma sedebokerense]|nr:hypothetical protein BKA69DRAFT_1165867 [Paraphysoderma sedebokerense]
MQIPLHLFILVIISIPVHCLVKYNALPKQGQIISLDSLPPIQSFTKNTTIQFPVSTASRAFRIQLYPHTELFESNGSVGNFYKGYVVGYEFDSTARFHVVGQHVEGVFSVPENETDKYFFVDGVENEHSEVNQLVVYDQISNQHNVGCGRNFTVSKDTSVLAPRRLRRRQSARKTCQVAVIADASFVSQHGAKSRDYMLQVMNTVSGIYERTFQINLAVKLVQVDGKANYGAVGPTGSLNALAADVGRGRFGFRNQDVCVAHMFVSRSDWGSTAGIANLGTVCRNGNVGMSTGNNGGRIQSAQLVALTVAHEIRHNFGANHSPDTNSIMAARLSYGATQFSRGSIQEISRNLNARCLTAGRSGPVTNQPQPKVPETGLPKVPTNRPNTPDNSKRPAVPDIPQNPNRPIPINPVSPQPRRPNRPQNPDTPALNYPLNPSQPPITPNPSQNCKRPIKKTPNNPIPTSYGSNSNQNFNRVVPTNQAGPDHQPS